ncbi:hypothetical protein [Azospirillum humicireducens]|uniref:polysaccharide deacetylase WbmS family protein n=1 Tax=Azospirillum humicireducens TaxID=1226968 RepID=UPI0011B2309C|nr:hypothetical protein [Azospirillum humicireducens]
MKRKIDLPIITLDVDWAPDWMIDQAASDLRISSVRATWFITHMSPAIQSLMQDPLFEIGLHPNFLAGSSHGDTPAAVLDHVRALAPQATAVRTHSLMQSEPLLELMATSYGMRVDCSLHLPLVGDLKPHRLRFGADSPWMTRLPHLFQDNMYMFLGRPWNLDNSWFQNPGLKIMDFHPIHVALNSSSMEEYEHLKKRGRLSDLRPTDIAPRDPAALGAGTLFRQVIASLRNSQSLTVSQCATIWEQENEQA